MHAEPFVGGGNLGFVPDGNWTWYGDSRFPADHLIKIHDKLAETASEPNPAMQ